MISIFLPNLYCCRLLQILIFLDARLRSFIFNSWSRIMYKSLFRGLLIFLLQFLSICSMRFSDSAVLPLIRQIQEFNSTIFRSIDSESSLVFVFVTYLNLVFEFTPCPPAVYAIKIQRFFIIPFCFLSNLVYFFAIPGMLIVLNLGIKSHVCGLAVDPNW